MSVQSSTAAGLAVLSFVLRNTSGQHSLRHLRTDNFKAHAMQANHQIALQASLYDRLAFLSRIPQPVYGHCIAWMAEYIGTTFFLFLALSGEQAAFAAAAAQDLAGPGVATLLYASLSSAFAFVVSSWVFFRVTSGLFNPAITLGMCVIGSLAWLRAMVIIFAQFLGAMTAAGLVDAIFPGPLLPTMALGSGTSTARGFFIEMFMSICFISMVFLMAAEKHKGTHVIAPVGIGLALFSVELSSILFTGGSVNPARAFAVALTAHSWPRYHWLYWLAPVLGCIPAAFLYQVIKLLEFEMADISHKEREASSTALPSHTGKVKETLGQTGQRLDVVPEDEDIESGVTRTS